ncbi:MAG: carboxypeptidase-like regulatory domain-containing protein [Bacteroidetes bacterium]|nr:carboxypeptidase-like regulatory domain-containing protein [Bacteroidota bacterium]
MKRIVYLLILLVSVNSVMAQTTIKGKVTDTKGEALIGVNIAVKNSYDGATTNVKGEFTFETNEKDLVIITATYIGYVPQEK